ncbi:MAG: D-alanyl-D-alanine carboxypeptidase/D-alanyl-D-alanine-endopeptidase [Fimbriimonadaceae bacterium]
MILSALSMAFAINQSSLKNNIDALIKPETDSGTLVGIYICRPSGEELYNHFSNLRMVPASNQKILSSVFAFDKFGSDFRFETKFWRDGDNVYIDAPGDMTITPEQLETAKVALGVSGKGYVYVKQLYRFEAGPSWEKDDLTFRYAPQITALCVNRAQFNVIGDKGIPLVPSWTGINIEHILGIGPSESSFDLNNRRVTIRGQIDPKATTLGSFALPDPDRVAARFFGRTFIATKNMPHRPPDYIIQSPQFASIAKMCLKPSDNLLAESFLLTASGASNYADAEKTLVDHLTKAANLPAGSIRPEDGSGMSRHNLVTPFALAQVLRHAYLQPYRDDFINALPSPGTGTLKSRMNGLNVIAKTGTLDSVSCLSGFVWLNNGEPVVFSIMMNHYVITAVQARKIQDTIVQSIQDSLNGENNETASVEWCDPLEKSFSISRDIRTDLHWLY